jgi:hypothetical protein
MPVETDDHAGRAWLGRSQARHNARAARDIQHTTAPAARPARSGGRPPRGRRRRGPYTAHRLLRQRPPIARDPRDAWSLPLPGTLQSIDKPNAGPQPRLEAGARRTLYAVACRPLFGGTHKWLTRRTDDLTPLPRSRDKISSTRRSEQALGGHRHHVVNASGFPRSKLGWLFCLCTMIVKPIASPAKQPDPRVRDALACSRTTTSPSRGLSSGLNSSAADIFPAGRQPRKSPARPP